MTLTFNIDGMHCDGCAGRIKTVLENAPGVHKAEAAFARGQARIHYNPHVIDQTKLVELIEQAGFSVQGQA